MLNVQLDQNNDASYQSSQLYRKDVVFDCRSAFILRETFARLWAAENQKKKLVANKFSPGYLSTDKIDSFGPCREQRIGPGIGKVCTFFAEDFSRDR